MGGDNQQKTEQQRVKIDYIKSSQFRVVHADGVFGGLTPRGYIHMDIWSERPPIPKQIVHELSPGEGIGEEIKSDRIGRETDWIREVEVGITLNLGLAKSLVKWLHSKIDSLEKALREAGNDKAGE